MSKIIEIARQCNIEYTIDPTEKPMRAFVECWEDELNDFAVSIIQECAKVYWNIDQSELHTDYVKALKEHFNIK